MFLSLDPLWEYRIQHGAKGPLYVTSSYSTWIFCRGVSGFATDCPCGVWCRVLATCRRHVGPPFGNRILNNSWAVGLTSWIINLTLFCVLTFAIIYVLIHQIIFGFIYSLFFKYSYTYIFHRRSLYTFYQYYTYADELYLYQSLQNSLSCVRLIYILLHWMRNIKSSFHVQYYVVGFWWILYFLHCTNFCYKHRF